MRLIDANKLVALLIKKYGSDENINESVLYLVGAISGAPTVDAEPARHGHWIEHEFGLMCSECGHYTEAMYDEPFNNEFGKGWAYIRPYYCGYCGAKMDEEAK